MQTKDLSFYGQQAFNKLSDYYYVCRTFTGVGRASLTNPKFKFLTFSDRSLFRHLGKLEKFFYYYSAPVITGDWYSQGRRGEIRALNLHMFF